MAIDFDEFKYRAKEYVEGETQAAVDSLSFVGSFNFLGGEDHILSVEMQDETDPGYWVASGSTLMNLYPKDKFVTADEAYTMHIGTMVRLKARSIIEGERPPDGIGYDAFICHASEDKEQIARPLAEALKTRGFYIWYDEFTLKVGDSLRRMIDQGLVNSKYGIVILSPDFFQKAWPQYELDGLITREIHGENVILPVWHKVEKEDVMGYSPSLADKIAAVTNDKTVAEVADELVKVLIE